jgi:hypothetical protein
LNIPDLLSAAPPPKPAKVKKGKKKPAASETLTDVKE